MKSIDAMHRYYGYSGGHCRDCCNYVQHRFNRTYHKCVAYGESHSLATDWRGKWDACGLFNRAFENLIPKRRPLVELNKQPRVHEKEPEEPMAGQVTLEEL